MPIRSGCGGSGQCGLCRVVIRSGNVALPDQSECRLLGEDALRNGLRLACRVTPVNDMLLELDADSFKPAWQRLDNLASSLAPDLGSLATSSPDQESCIGLGVDLGTTHLRLALWDLPSGIFVAGRTGLNPQAVFGADVLTRLTMAAESSETAAQISRSVEEAIRDALGDISLGDTLSLARIHRAVIVGNTAMLALLCRRNYPLLLNPDNWMRQIDCTPQNALQWARIWGLAEGARIEIVPPLAGFVGSDLLAGVLATGLVEGPPGSLLIDCGTNAEIALWDGNVLWATSAAGGPAFEGSGVGCGMPAEGGRFSRSIFPAPAPISSAR